MHPLRLLVKTSRPWLWVAPLLMFLVGVKLSGAVWDGMLVLFLLLLTFPYNLFVYGINDVYDYPSDKKNPRKGGKQGMILAPRYHAFILRSGLIAAGVLVGVAVATLNLSVMVAVGLMVLFSYVYSVPPLRLKELPPLDSLSNVFIYYVGPLGLGWSLGFPLVQLPIKYWILGLAVMAAHMFTTIFDYSADKQAGHRTFAVVFGKRTAALIPAFLLLAVFFLSDLAYVGVNILLVVGVVSMFVVFVYPSEKFALRLATVMFFLFLLTGFLWLVL